MLEVPAIEQARELVGERLDAELLALVSSRDWAARMPVAASMIASTPATSRSLVSEWV
jgi:hypothetical protein